MGHMTGNKAYRNRLLVLPLILSLCLSFERTALAEAPIQVLATSTRNSFPVELFFDIEAVDEASEIVSIQLSYRMRGQGSETIAPLQFDPGRRVEASYRWHTERLTIPPGIPVEYHWLIKDEAGNLLQTEPQVVYFDDVRFDWQVHENKDIAVFWYGGGESVGERLFDAAVAALQRLSATTQASLEFPLRIVVYASEGDFRSAFPYLNEWVGGQAFTEAALIVLYAESDAGSLAWTLEQGIPHEISHILFHQATDHPYSSPPTWLNEGLAMYNENASHHTELALVGRAVQRGELLSLAQISGGFPPDPDVARLSYAESLTTVQFILDRYGPEGMAALLRAFKDGKSTDEAVQQALSLSLQEFEEEWRAYLVQTTGSAEPELLPLPAEAPRLSLVWLLGGLCCASVVAFTALAFLVFLVSRRARS
jgi:hypothetical protein